MKLSSSITQPGLLVRQGHCKIQSGELDDYRAAYTRRAFGNSKT